MKTTSIILVCLSLTFLACEKDSDDSGPSIPPLTITVYSATDWSPVYTPPCSGATIILTGSAGGSHTIVTDVEGKAVFDNLEIKTYIIEVSKDNLSNVVDKDQSSGAGFLPIGIFQTAEEVNSYTAPGGDLLQPNAEPGDLILYDINADGLINDDDRITEVSFNYIPYVDINNDRIISELDKLDGEYQFADRVRVNVYIGE